jgi:hypothetical protein
LVGLVEDLNHIRNGEQRQSRLILVLDF